MKTSFGDALEGLIVGARGVASQGAEAASSAIAAVPSVDEAKRGLGLALILGGRALIDPKAVIGELAVELGQALAGGEELWIALAHEEEQLAVIAHGRHADVLEQARVASETRRVLMCKVQEAYGKLGGQPAGSET